jgi:hypothetical protein
LEEKKHGAWSEELGAANAERLVEKLKTEILKN